ncbi:MAG: MFS transporter [Verrucomicrobia bacterium]|nr:MFS transporter [Verrucomicrobiota bacterium]
MEADLKPQSAASPAGRTTPPNYKWWVVFMLWFVCFFNYADRQALSGIAPKLKEEFHFTNDQMGLIGSAFMWIYAAGAPFAGFIADRFRRVNLILGGCFFWSVVTVATGWCSQLWQFIGVRALEGFGETFYFPASMSLVSDYHSPKTRSRAMAFHQSSVYAGTILGSWLGALLAQELSLKVMLYVFGKTVSFNAAGWQLSFFVFGTLGMVLAGALFVFLREPKRGESEFASIAPAASPDLRTTLADIFHTRTAPLLMLVFAGANAVAGVFLFWTPTFLVKKFHFQLAAAGLNGAVYIHLASACSVPFCGMLADKLASRYAGGRILAQAFGLLVGAGFLSLVGLAENVKTLLIAMTCFGLCKGCYDAGIFASLYDVVPPRSRATAAGIMNTVGWIGGAIATWLTGWYADHGSHGSDVANMSHAIAYGGLIYLAGAGILIAAATTLLRRDTIGAARDLPKS